MNPRIPIPVLVALLIISSVCVLSLRAADEPKLVDAGAPFGQLPLIDEINCGDANDPHEFSEEPKGTSKIETLLGAACRILPNAGPSKYFAYRIGKGKGLKAKTQYVLQVEYPEDKPRTVFILNRGAETNRGFNTGNSLGDLLYGYVDSNPESIQLPMANAYRTWKTVFYLQEHFPGIKQPRGQVNRPDTPETGFLVLIAQPDGYKDPLNEGAAVSKIRLFELPNPERLVQKINFPPAGLPRRHLFFREEMSDGLIGGKKPEERGFASGVDWYEGKAKMMQFLGMNTFTKDLLEFGHNQGWDSTPYGGNDWFYQTPYPKLWEETLNMLAKYKLDVLPYYEYCGSIGGKGLGSKKHAQPLGAKQPNLKDYTHVSWVEKTNLDLTDPEAVEDVHKLLDATIYKFKNVIPFVGAWFRPRPSEWPVSFADATLARYSKDNNGTAVTREELKKDAKLLEKYTEWWHEQRKNYLAKIRDDVQKELGNDSRVLFTAITSEPGPGIGGIVTDQADKVKEIFAHPTQPEMKKQNTKDFVQSCNGEDYLMATCTPPGSWAHWEWDHACPAPDPQRTNAEPSILQTYPFNKVYTVGAAKNFDAFRNHNELAIVRHYSLNEHAIPEALLGYFVADVERTGPYSMLGEARAMANGDPRYIGYLASNNFNRGFPEYARNFNAAFLSLPALPSEIVKDAASDPEVIVRMIKTPSNGTYFAVINTGLGEKKNVSITLPVAGAVKDAATDTAIDAAGGKWAVNFYPCEMRALVVK